MKFNYVQALLAMALSVFLTYGFFTFGDTANVLHLKTEGVLFIVFALIFSVVTNFEFSRNTIVLRNVSFGFFLIGLMGNMLLTSMQLSIASSLIVNVVFVLGYGILLKILLNTEKPEWT